jgi:integrase
MGTRKRSPGTGSVFVRPNRRSTALITDGDGRRSIGTFPTRRAAETALAAALVDGPPPAIEATFGDYLTEWLADQTLVLKATTAARNRSVIATYVMGRKIASKRVRDLVPQDFRCLYGDLAKRGRRDGGPLAPGTIKTLDQVLKAAVGQLVDARVLRWTSIPRRAVKVVATERPWVTIPTVRELIRFARFRDPNLEVVIRIGALAGLRRGEICGLRWNDIDLDAGTATVRRNRVVADGAVGESSPKTTSSAATITLDPDTVAALDRHRRRRADLIEADVPTTEHVICTATGGGLDPTNLSDRAIRLRRNTPSYSTRSFRPRTLRGGSDEKCGGVGLEAIPPTPAERGRLAKGALLRPRPRSQPATRRPFSRIPTTCRRIRDSRCRSPSHRGRYRRRSRRSHRARRPRNLREGRRYPSRRSTCHRHGHRREGLGPLFHREGHPLVLR